MSLLLFTSPAIQAAKLTFSDNPELGLQDGEWFGVGKMGCGGKGRCEAKTLFQVRLWCLSESVAGGKKEK